MLTRAPSQDGFSTKLLLIKMYFYEAKILLSKLYDRTTISRRPLEMTAALPIGFSQCVALVKFCCVNCNLLVCRKICSCFFLGGSDDVFTCLNSLSVLETFYSDELYGTEA
jgi:hypothetical protein